MTTVEDIAAMRAEGSFGEFLKHLGGKPQRTVSVAAAEPPAPQAQDPGRRPGAWPIGTRPPGPVEPQDPAAWQHAVAEYRAYLATGDGPDGPPSCECTGCQTIANSTRRTS